MALIYDERHKPGLHALIIGVEAAPGPFSCAASAASVAEWLRSFEASGTKLASIDLLIHAAEPASFAGRQLESRPTSAVVHDAVNGWRERLQGDRQNAGFFYFSGPTAGHENETALILPEPVQPEPLPLPNLIDLDNLWQGMGDLPQRQLFFIEASPAHRRDVAPGASLNLLLLPAATHLGRGLRARYLGKVPAMAGPASHAPPLSGALRDALDDDGLIDTRELGARLARSFDRRLRAMGLGSTEPLETAYEGNFAIPSLFANLGRVLSADGSPAAAGKAGGNGTQDGKARRKGARPKGSASAGSDPEAPPPADLAARIASLTPQQESAMRLLSLGQKGGEIAEALGISGPLANDELWAAAKLLGARSPREAAELLVWFDAQSGPAAPDAGGAVAQSAAEAVIAAAEGDGAGKKAETDSAQETKLAAKRRAARQREQAGRVARLSEGQRACLRMVYRHMETKDIALALGISPDGVAQRIKTAMRILGVHRRRDAALILAEVEGPAPVFDTDEPLRDAAGVDRRAGGPAAKSARQDAAVEGQPAPRRAAPPPEPNTHFVTDDPEVERDELGRGPLAIALGRRLHRIWCRSNGIRVPGDELVEAGGDERSAFVLHLDAPWGGGKTSFANFLARVLNPFPRGGSAAAKFLAERAGGAVGTIFIDDPPADGGEGGTAADWAEDGRRPWIVVNFNAWQAEHCTPPWWTFYQAIRKGCFKAVWEEGRDAARPAQASAPPRPLIEERIWSWAALWRRELMWRLRTPKVISRLSTFAVAAVVTAALWQMGLIFRNQTGALALDTANALGLALVGATTVSGLWSLGALLTESVAPGTDDLAERRSLGGSDPFERFRRHFARTMAAVRRPVMVIVDDLDRCRPDFVVDLVRGIQTLLKSPRVVFVILGDRDWIERAFEAHHAAMSKVNVGPEQDFGARFVEKAIQMSFILPEIAESSQDSYVRRVLIGPGGSGAAADAPAPPEIAQQLRSDYREKVAAAATPEARKQAEDELLEQYRGELEVAAKAEAISEVPGEAAARKLATAAAATAEQQAIKVLSEERALLAAVDERMGQALLHRLEPLARFFPPNPRQIKRIVNAITMYTAVAYLQMDMDESDPRGVELAIWVIIMTEWPKTWRVLASCPQLADLLAGEEPEAALAAIDESALPGSRESTLRELNRIRADRDLMALITEGDEGRPRLSSASVELFVRLTPLYSRKQRLAGEAAAGAGQAPPAKG